MTFASLSSLIRKSLYALKDSLNLLKTEKKINYITNEITHFRNIFIKQTSTKRDFNLISRFKNNKIIKNKRKKRERESLSAKAYIG